MRKTLLIFASMMLITLLGYSQTLTWQFNNFEVINAGTQLRFDVEVKADVAGTFQRDLQVYFDYNTAGFGSDIVANAWVTVTPLALMQNYYSVVNMVDNTSSKLAIITEADNEFDQAGSADYFNEMPTTFTGLLQFTIDIIDNTALAGIAFDQDLMNGGQYYQSTSSTDPIKYTDPSLYGNDLSTSKLSTLYGTITYANASATILTGCTVELLDGGSPIDMADNDITGMYYFSALNDGNYTLETTCNNVYGGMNVLDVFVLRSYLAYGTPVLSTLQLLAADVTVSSGVNTLDVLIMRQKIANQNPPAWHIADYVFEVQNATVTGGIGNVDYQGLCGGDVNASYTPPVN
jgi:hypothetical protein